MTQSRSGPFGNADGRFAAKQNNDQNACAGTVRTRDPVSRGTLLPMRADSRKNLRRSVAPVRAQVAAATRRSGVRGQWAKTTETSWLGPGSGDTRKRVGASAGTCRDEVLRREPWMAVWIDTRERNRNQSGCLPEQRREISMRPTRSRVRSRWGSGASRCVYETEIVRHGAGSEGIVHASVRAQWSGPGGEWRTCTRRSRSTPRATRSSRGLRRSRSRFGVSGGRRPAVRRTARSWRSRGRCVR